MKKTVVTLDPEYIPWEGDHPVVKLRRMHNKKARAIVGIVLFVALFAVMGVLASRSKPTARPLTLAAPTATALPIAAPGTPAPTPSLEKWGSRAGYVGLIRHNVITFVKCATYRVTLETVILAEGSTDDGPVVHVEYPVRVECDHEAFNF